MVEESCHHCCLRVGVDHCPSSWKKGREEGKWEGRGDRGKVWRRGAGEGEGGRDSLSLQVKVENPNEAELEEGGQRRRGMQSGRR